MYDSCITDLVAEREMKAIEDDLRASEAVRFIVEKEIGLPWTRISLTELIAVQAGVSNQTASTALDDSLFSVSKGERLLKENDSWEVIPKK